MSAASVPSPYSYPKKKSPKKKKEQILIRITPVTGSPYYIWGLTNQKRRTRDRFGTAGVSNVNELLDKNVVFVVVPIRKDDGEFVVIVVRFVRCVDRERRAETVDVLTV